MSNKIQNKSLFFLRYLAVPESVAESQNVHLVHFTSYTKPFCCTIGQRSSTGVPRSRCRPSKVFQTTELCLIFSSWNFIQSLSSHLRLCTLFCWRQLIRPEASYRARGIISERGKVSQRFFNSLLFKKNKNKQKTLTMKTKWTDKYVFTCVKWKNLWASTVVTLSTITQQNITTLKSHIHL